MKSRLIIVKSKAILLWCHKISVPESPFLVLSAPPRFEAMWGVEAIVKTGTAAAASSPPFEQATELTFVSDRAASINTHIQEWIVHSASLLMD